MRSLALAVLVAFAVPALAGCGGKSTPVNDATELVPADVLAYAVFQPSTGEQSLEAKAPLVARYANELRSRFGIRHAPVAAQTTIDVARLPSGTVAFARPDDPKRFSRRLGPGFVHRTIGGWVVFARSEAPIDAVRHRKRTLADQPRFHAAVRALPDRPAYWAYAPGWSAGAVAVGGRTITLELVTDRLLRRNVDTSAVAKRIPSRAVAAFAGAPETVPAGGLAALRPVARFLTLDLHALVAGLDGPFAAWAAPGAPVPEVTVVAQPRHPARALAAVRKVVGRMAGTAPGRALDLGPLTVTTALASGQLVTSDVDAPLAGPGPLRPDGLPASSEWWLYLDAARALPAMRTLAALANTTVPARVDAELRTVRSVLAYAAHTGRVERTVASFEVP
ncbi:MAG TPA: hypothetical protein VHC67_15340 [Gaiellaceae bacterium]|nr:hypothetical protein [Gaiellaceae bacterium]